MKLRAIILVTALALGGACDDDGTNPPGTTQTGNPNTVPGAIGDGLVDTVLNLSHPFRL